MPGQCSCKDSERWNQQDPTGNNLGSPSNMFMAWGNLSLQGKFGISVSSQYKYIAQTCNGGD